MHTRCFTLLLALPVATSVASAQATGNPSFTAPVPVFAQSEVGGVVSLADRLGVAYELVYRHRDPFGSVDLTARGGLLEHRGAIAQSMLVGLELRKQIGRHEDGALVDAAFTAGIGGRVRTEAAAFMVPIGITAGRRLALGRSLSVTPYLHPTVLVRYGTAVRSEVLGILGVGADLSLHRMLELRLNAGLGAIRGISVGAVLIQ